MVDRRLLVLALALCMVASAMALPIDLTTETFDKHTASGTWMIKLYVLVMI